jgi:hypothetical protein
MATSCEDVSARMVELLYGELPADARSGVDAHVAGCARCRSELEGLERTRAVTRRALDESPPPRARAAIMRHAAEHLAAQRPAAAAAAIAPVPAPAAKKPPAPESQRASFWDWLRSRWTLPSLATVGAVALLVIGSRVLLEPEKLDYKGSPEFQRQAGGAEAPASAAAPAPVAAPAPAIEPAPPPATTAESHAEKDVARKPPRDDAKLAAASEGSHGVRARQNAKLEKADVKPASARPRTASAPAKTAGPAAKKAWSDPYGDVGRFAPPPPPKPVTGFRMDSDQPLDDASSADKAAPAKPGGIKGGGVGTSGFGSGGGGKLEERSLAKERPAAEARAPRLAEPAPAPAAAPPVAASPPPPAPAAPSRREAEKKAKRAADDEESAAPAEGRGAAAAPAPAGKSKASAETAVERANRLFTEGRWAEAAAAYRELLRRDPNNADAPRWRQRLAVAEAALESRRSEPAQAAPAH